MSGSAAAAAAAAGTVGEAEFAAFLARHRERVEALEREVGDAWWRANIAATPEAEERAARVQKRLTRVYADASVYAWLRGVDPSRLSPDAARQHKLLLDAHTANQMDDATIEALVDTEKEVESAYNNFRPLLRGERVGENALRDILRDSDDAVLRREAWEATKEIGPRWRVGSGGWSTCATVKRAGSVTGTTTRCR
jgi:peptidyl-dipeptidase A